MRVFGLLLLASCAGKIDITSPCAPSADAAAADPVAIDAGVAQFAPPDAAPDPGACNTSADCDGELCTGGRCTPCSGNGYQECFGDPSYGPGFFCFSDRCRSLACSNENSACPQIAGRECCNLGDGTLACVIGTCCNDQQCGAPETCVNHTCQ